eukprot:11908034-Prorocentrum_lima.AAC.1
MCWPEIRCRNICSSSEYWLRSTQGATRAMFCAGNYPRGPADAPPACIYGSSDTASPRQRRMHSA